MRYFPAGNLSLDASSTIVGTNVFTVTAADADSASLTFSMTSFPATPDLFSNDAGKVNYISRYVISKYKVYWISFYCILG
jgi:hypothetical protein